MQKKPLIYLQKVYLDSERKSFRYALFLDGNVITSFSSWDRYRACIAVENLWYAIFQDTLDPLNVQIYE